MATGDTDDMMRRARRVLPRWFSDASPKLDIILSAGATLAAQLYALIANVRLQARITTATGGFLDLIAYDFFGLRFRRRSQEADAAFMVRIKTEIIRPRATRASIIAAVESLTGRPTYLFFEPWNPRDTGGYGVGGHMGYSCMGRYGSLMLPNQAFMIPIRPPGQGIPDAQGYQLSPGDAAIGGMGEGSLRYAAMSDVVGPVTDADILAAIESCRPAGCVIWTDIESTNPERFLNLDAILDEATLA